MASDSDPDSVFHGMGLIEIDDPDSPEALAADEYVRKHHQYLPPTGEVNLSGVDLKRYRTALMTPFSSEEDREEALMKLGHAGTVEALRILTAYHDKPPSNLKFRIWARLARDECRKFYRNTTEDVGPSVTISRVEESRPSREESITITYDRALQEITGRKSDRIPVEGSEPFMAVLSCILRNYPPIEEKYPPRKLGIKVNGSPPGGHEQLEPGSTIDLTVPDSSLP